MNSRNDSIRPPCRTSFQQASYAAFRNLCERVLNYVVPIFRGLGL